MVEIIGEAAKRVSQPTQSAHPGIPWSEVIGMRHRLVHGYDAIDYRVLWDVIQFDLPTLIPALESILQRE